MTAFRRNGLAAAAALMIAGSVLPANAESAKQGGGNPGWGSLGQGMMMGPGMMDRSEFNRLCRPGAAGFAEWRIDRLEAILKPTDAQRAKFEDFKTASSAAADSMRTACPTEIPTSMVGHMKAMEKLTDAKAQAIKLVLPKLETFYDTLSSDQKSKLDSREGRSRFWRWLDHV